MGSSAVVAFLRYIFSISLEQKACVIACVYMRQRLWVYLVMGELACAGAAPAGGGITSFYFQKSLRASC